MDTACGWSAALRTGPTGRRCGPRFLAQPSLAAGPEGYHGWLTRRAMLTYSNLPPAPKCPRRLIDVIQETKTRQPPPEESGGPRRGGAPKAQKMQRLNDQLVLGGASQLGSARLPQEPLARVGASPPRPPIQPGSRQLPPLVYYAV